MLQQQRTRPVADPWIPRRVGALLGGAVIGVIGLAYVGLRNPHDRSVPMPRCPIHWATGLDCPGCGGLRMTHDLLHRDLAAAWADNAVLLLLLPLLLFLGGRFVLAWVQGRSGPVNRGLGIAILVVAVAWMVVRNLA